MKQIIWSHATERHVHDKHGIALADIADAIRHGGLLAVLDTHRPEVYYGQRRYVVQMGHEVYVAPFRETATHIVLLTAYPSRKLRQQYLR